MKYLSLKYYFVVFVVLPLFSYNKQNKQPRAPAKYVCLLILIFFAIIYRGFAQSPGTSLPWQWWRWSVVPFWNTPISGAWEI